MLIIFGSVGLGGGGSRDTATGFAVAQGAAAAQQGIWVRIAGIAKLDGLEPLPTFTTDIDGMQIHILESADSSPEPALEAGRLVVLNTDVPYEIVMAAALAAHRQGQPIMLCFPFFPDWLDMPRLHALLGRADTLVLRQADLERAVEMLGHEMLCSDYCTPVEMAAALANWASFTVIATEGKSGLILAESEKPVQRFLSPSGQDIDTDDIGNRFIGKLAADLMYGKPAYDSVRCALESAVGLQTEAIGPVD